MLSVFDRESCLCSFTVKSNGVVTDRALLTGYVKKVQALRDLCSDDSHHVRDGIRLHHHIVEWRLIKSQYLRAGLRLGQPLNMQTGLRHSWRVALVCCLYL